MARNRSSRKQTGETVLIDETRLGPFQVRVSTGAATFIVDEAMGAGGQGSGPNPYDLLSAAIGSSSAMTMRLFATKRKWPLDQIRVKVTHMRSDLHTRDAFLKEIVLLGSLDAAQRAKVLEISTRCPLHISIARSFDVKTVLLDALQLDESVVTIGKHMRDMTTACKN
jgi:putative redox protein